MSKIRMTVHLSETSPSLRKSSPKTFLALCINSKILKKETLLRFIFSFSIPLLNNHDHSPFIKRLVIE